MTETRESAPGLTAQPRALVVPELLAQRARVHPDGLAFVVDGGEQLGYREWDERSTAIAHGLLARGIKRGDRIGLLFGGMAWVPYATGYFGVLKAGATAVHLNADQPVEELLRRAEQAGLTGVVHAAGREVPAGLPGWSGCVEELDAGDHSPVPADVRPEDIADLVFTSGTTGRAKAYTIPHGNATFGRKIGEMGTFGASSYLLTMLQIATGSSASALNIATISQVVTVFGPVGEVHRVGQLVEQYRAGIVAITPSIANDMIQAGLHEKYDLSSVTMLACGSAPLPPARADRLLEMFPGVRIATACSQSEASPALVLNMYDPSAPTSVGLPSPVTGLRIVLEDGSDAGPGTVGEIWLSHPAPKRLYLDRPEANALIEADGWYRTGDLGRRDDQGRLHLFDRQVDAIRTAGGLVSSLAVEAALFRHPAVRDAAAFGAPADAPEQEIVAAVVLDPAVLDPRTAAADLAAHLERLLPARELPARIVELPELPRNSQNKVLKRVLRQQHG